MSQMICCYLVIPVSWRHNPLCSELHQKAILKCIHWCQITQKGILQTFILAYDYKGCRLIFHIVCQTTNYARFEIAETYVTLWIATENILMTAKWNLYKESLILGTAPDILIHAKGSFLSVLCHCSASFEVEIFSIQVYCRNVKRAGKETDCIYAEADPRGFPPTPQN